jgi:hypothetical protein
MNCQVAFMNPYETAYATPEVNGNLPVKIQRSMAPDMGNEISAEVATHLSSIDLD